MVCKKISRYQDARVDARMHESNYRRTTRYITGKLYKKKKDIEHLKDVLMVTYWEQISQACIDRQFRKRLASIIAAKGGHVEHFFERMKMKCSTFLRHPV